MPLANINFDDENAAPIVEEEKRQTQSWIDQLFADHQGRQGVGMFGESEFGAADDSLIPRDPNVVSGKGFWTDVSDAADLDESEVAERVRDNILIPTVNGLTSQERDWFNNFGDDDEERWSVLSENLVENPDGAGYPAKVLEAIQGGAQMFQDAEAQQDNYNWAHKIPAYVAANPGTVAAEVALEAAALLMMITPEPVSTAGGGLLHTAWRAYRGNKLARSFARWYQGGNSRLGKVGRVAGGEALAGSFAAGVVSPFRQAETASVKEQVGLEHSIAEGVGFDILAGAVAGGVIGGGIEGVRLSGKDAIQAGLESGERMISRAKVAGGKLVNSPQFRETAETLREAYRRRKLTADEYRIQMAGAARQLEIYTEEGMNAAKAAGLKVSKQEIPASGVYRPAKGVVNLADDVSDDQLAAAGDIALFETSPRNEIQRLESAEGIATQYKQRLEAGESFADLREEVVNGALALPPNDPARNTLMDALFLAVPGHESERALVLERIAQAQAGVRKVSVPPNLPMRSTTIYNFDHEALAGAREAIGNNLLRRNRLSTSKRKYGRGGNPWLDLYIFLRGQGQEPGSESLSGVSQLSESEARSLLDIHHFQRRIMETPDDPDLMHEVELNNRAALDLAEDWNTKVKGDPDPTDPDVDWDFEILPRAVDGKGYGKDDPTLALVATAKKGKVDREFGKRGSVFIRTNEEAVGDRRILLSVTTGRAEEGGIAKMLGHQVFFLRDETQRNLRLPFGNSLETGWERTSVIRVYLAATEEAFESLKKSGQITDDRIIRVEPSSDLLSVGREAHRTARHILKRGGKPEPGFKQPHLEPTQRTLLDAAIEFNKKRQAADGDASQLGPEELIKEMEKLTLENLLKDVASNSEFLSTIFGVSGGRGTSLLAREQIGEIAKSMLGQDAKLPTGFENAILIQLRLAEESGPVFGEKYLHDLLKEAQAWQATHSLENARRSMAMARVALRNQAVDEPIGKLVRLLDEEVQGLSRPKGQPGEATPAKATARLSEIKELAETIGVDVSGLVTKSEGGKLSWKKGGMLDFVDLLADRAGRSMKGTVDVFRRDEAFEPAMLKALNLKGEEASQFVVDFAKKIYDENEKGFMPYDPAARATRETGDPIRRMVDNLVAEMERAGANVNAIESLRRPSFMFDTSPGGALRTGGLHGWRLFLLDNKDLILWPKMQRAAGNFDRLDASEKQQFEQFVIESYNYNAYNILSRNELVDERQTEKLMLRSDTFDQWQTVFNAYGEKNDIGGALASSLSAKVTEAGRASGVSAVFGSRGRGIAKKLLDVMAKEKVTPKLYHYRTKSLLETVYSNQFRNADFHTALGGKIQDYLNRLVEARFDPAFISKELSDFDRAHRKREWWSRRWRFIMRDMWRPASAAKLVAAPLYVAGDVIMRAEQSAQYSPFGWKFGRDILLEAKDFVWNGAKYAIGKLQAVGDFSKNPVFISNMHAKARAANHHLLGLLQAENSRFFGGSPSSRGFNRLTRTIETATVQSIVNEMPTLLARQKAHMSLIDYMTFAPSNSYETLQRGDGGRADLEFFQMFIKGKINRFEWDKMRKFGGDIDRMRQEDYGTFLRFEALVNEMGDTWAGRATARQEWTMTTPALAGTRTGDALAAATVFTQYITRMYENIWNRWRVNYQSELTNLTNEGVPPKAAGHFAKAFTTERAAAYAAVVYAAMLSTVYFKEGPLKNRNIDMRQEEDRRHIQSQAIAYSGAGLLATDIMGSVVGLANWERTSATIGTIIQTRLPGVSIGIDGGEWLWRTAKSGYFWTGGRYLERKEQERVMGQAAAGLVESILPTKPIWLRPITNRVVSRRRRALKQEQPGLASPFIDKPDIGRRGALDRGFFQNLKALRNPRFFREDLAPKPRK